MKRWLRLIKDIVEALERFSNEKPDEDGNSTRTTARNE